MSKKPHLTTSNIFEETPHLDVKETRQAFPGSPKPSFMSIFRWMNRGKLGLDGKLHRLESFITSRKRFCSRQSIARFLEAINRRPEHAISPESPSRTASHADAVESELQAAGLI